MKVLLVDDEIEFVTTLARRLSMRGIAADVVFDGQQALDYVKKQKPDVMVIDMVMPHLSGMQVLRQLRVSHPDIQVVILAGHSLDNDTREAERLNASSFLIKPVDVESLIHHIWSAYRIKTKKSTTADTLADISR